MGAVLVCYIGPTVSDGMSSMIIDGFKQLKRLNIHLASDPSRPGFYKRCKTAHLVLVGTNQGVDWRVVRNIAKCHGRWAILDGSDYADFKGIKKVDPAQVPLIFKREFYPADHDESRVFPLSFSVMSGWHERPHRAEDTFIDFSFAGREYKIRHPFMRAMRSLRNPHSIVSAGGLIASQYWAMMDASKIGVSLRGAGWDCVRTFEILSRPNCLLMLQKPPIRMSEPELRDGVHCVMFETPTELKEKLRHYLVHEDERMRIACAGYELSCQKHLTQHRAKYIFRTCLQNIPSVKEAVKAH